MTLRVQGPSSVEERHVTRDASVVVETSGASDSEFCFPDYECQFTYPDPNGRSFWSFDFSTLCNAMQDYVTPADAFGHTYNFNICGMSRFRCVPYGSTPLVPFGVAVQVWGFAPTCNMSNPQCTDPVTHTPMCCSEPCEPLGVGRPIYEPIDPSNLKSGGIAVTQRGVYTAYVTIEGLQHMQHLQVRTP